MNPIKTARRCSPGARIDAAGAGGWKLTIPPGPAGRYRLAQLDDYGGLKRSSYPWTPPVELALRARVGAAKTPGTWGFGFWNAPTSFSLGVGSTSPFPALPQAAWYFQASPASHLAFRDDLPGSGFLAQVFRTRRYPGWWLLGGPLAAPLLAWRRTARRLRHFISRRLIDESGADLSAIDVTAEHAYRLTWGPDQVQFAVDGRTVLSSSVSPRPPLALVIWIDNQFAAFDPAGRVRYGLHPAAEPHWLEIADVRVNGQPLQLAGTAGVAGP